jgi:hypothetical protein
MNKSLGEKLQSLPRELLYLILILCTAGPLVISQFVKVQVPNQPTDSAIDFFVTLRQVPEGKTVLIQSDWTNSSRGESGGSFEALIRILMRQGTKFAFYSGADPQAPQVARDVIARLNEERVAAGQPAYKRWDDWVDLGYFPAVDTTNKAMATNLRKAFAGREAAAEGQPMRDVFQSPILKGVTSFDDLGAFVVVTASNTSITAIERLSGKRSPMLMMVTGVMGPETMVYYASKQLKGLAVGLKGVYDVETLMEYGLNSPGPATAKVKANGRPSLPGYPGQVNFGKGGAYYPTLHVALTLLIVAVIVGNIGMFLSRRQNKS